MRQATMTTYDQDFYTWAMEQAQLLREGRLSELDVNNIAEELEDVGKSQAWTLRSQLERFIAHLLKWCHQSKGRKPGRHRD
jgi:hypothetical protein